MQNSYSCEMKELAVLYENNLLCMIMRNSGIFFVGNNASLGPVSFWKILK